MGLTDGDWEQAVWRRIYADPDLHDRAFQLLDRVRMALRSEDLAQLEEAGRYVEAEVHTGSVDCAMLALREFCLRLDEHPALGAQKGEAWAKVFTALIPHLPQYGLRLNDGRSRSRALRHLKLHLVKFFRLSLRSYRHGCTLRVPLTWVALLAWIGCSSALQIGGAQGVAVSFLIGLLVPPSAKLRFTAKGVRIRLDK